MESDIKTKYIIDNRVGSNPSLEFDVYFCIFVIKEPKLEGG